MSKKTRNFTHYILISVVFIFATAILFFAQKYRDSIQYAELSSAQNRTLYVSTNGNDANSGSASSPYRTIQTAINKAVAGDTILIENGTYRERITTTKSGNSGNPITIKGNGNNVVIDGGDRSNQWRKVSNISGNVYENTSVGYEVGNMTINNRYIVEVKKDTITSSTLSSTFVKGPLGNWNSSEAVFGTFNNRTYLGLSSNQDPNSLDIATTPKLAGAFTIDGGSYLVLDNLKIQNSYFGVHLDNNANNNIIKNSQISGNNFGIGVRNGAYQNTIHNNYFTLSYKFSLSPYTSYANELWDTFKSVSNGDREAIDCYKGGDNNIVSNNTVREHFGGFYTGRGGDTYCKAWKVFNNNLENISDDGLEPEGNISNSHWYNNTVTNARQGIRIKEPVGGPLYVYNNKFVTSQNRGIYYVASARAQVFVYQNSVIRTPTASLIATTLTGGDLSDSLFVNNLMIGDKFGQTNNGGKSVNFYHNGVIAVSKPPSLDGTNKILLFANLNNYNSQTQQLSEFSSTGINISKSFSVGGRTYSALPGSNNATVGAINVSAPATPPPSPVSTPVSNPTPTPVNNPTASPVSYPPANQPNSLIKAINFNGPTLSTGGITYQAESASGITANANRFENQNVTLNPSTDATLSQIIRSSIWGTGDKPQVSIPNIANGNYNVYLYLWEDNNSQSFDISLESQVVRGNFTSGNAGNWQKVGPLSTTVSDGTLNITFRGGDANLSALEVWSTSNTPTPPPSTPTPVSTPRVTPTPVPTTNATPITVDRNINIWAYGTQAGGAYPAIKVWVNDKYNAGTFNVNQTEKMYTKTIPVNIANPSDIQSIKVEFTNDFAGNNANGVWEDRNLHVTRIVAAGKQILSTDPSVIQSGVWRNSTCSTGNFQTTYLACGGYFLFPF